MGSTGAELEAVSVREATRADLSAIVEMLSRDPLGATREQFSDPLPRAYHDAFAAIERDPNNVLLVGELRGDVVAVLQFTLIPNLTYRGRWRGQIEGVRVDPRFRGRGLGRVLVDAAIERARAADCRLVQLTTDKRRPGALRFYESVGFVASHEGMKLHLHGSSGRESGDAAS